MQRAEEEEYSTVRSSVRRVCKVLAAMPSLSLLSIQLGLDLKISPLHNVLRPFSILRNVQKAIVGGYSQRDIETTELWHATSQQSFSSDERMKLVRENRRRLTLRVWISQTTIATRGTFHRAEGVDGGQFAGR